MGPKMLVIDDDVEFTTMLEEICREQGFTVLTAHSGREGLVMALSEHPDVIICDYFMPEMSGLDVARELRANEWGKQVPIMFLTNMSISDVSIDDSLSIECVLKTDVTLEDIALRAKALIARK